MAWTLEQKRRARFLAGQESYIQSCAFSGRAEAAKVAAVMGRLIVAKLRPAPNLMLTATFPDRFGSNNKRRWAVDEFLRRTMTKGSYVYAVELHKSGDAHAHAVGCEPGLRRLSLHDAWHWQTGGFMRVEEVKSTEDCVLYVAKYIAKGDQGELEFGGAVR